MSTSPGITLHNITLHTLGSGRGITLKGQGGLSGDITVTYNEFSPGGGGPVPFNFENGSGTGTGMTIYSIHSGVLMAGLSAPNIAFLAANLPDGYPGNGEIWTAHWSPGSTYATTPVATYYTSNGPAGPALIFYVLDPADNTYHTGTAGTFNFPMTLVAGTTTTTFMP